MKASDDLIHGRGLTFDPKQGINNLACGFGRCLPDPNVIVRAIETVDTFKRKIESGGLGCDTPMPNMCSPTTNYTILDASLPTSTRCWAGYQPSTGESSALSCSAADTCFNQNAIGIEPKQIVCDGCPLRKGEDFLPYACSSLTKKCTCGVQRFERTRCTSHEQCFTPTSGASCMRVANIFSTAFSTVPCEQCTTQQVCMVTSAASTGYCACPFTDVEVSPILLSS